MSNGASANKSPSGHNQDKFPYILGLDVGTNSVGWAIVRCRVEKSSGEKEIIDKTTGEVKTSVSRDKYLPVSLHSLNSRIFQERVDAKTRTPKNQHRRAMRGARRRIDRLQYRRRALSKLLVEQQLLPADFAKQPEQHLNIIDRGFAERVLGKKWDTSWSENDKKWISPYAIRARAIEQPLEAHEFGRLLLHLQKRRGYFSNRDIKYKELHKYIDDVHPGEQGTPSELGAGGRDDDIDDRGKDSRDKQKAEETRKVLGGIRALEQAKGESTLGQYIWERAIGDDSESSMPRRITRYSVTTQKHERKTEPDGTLPVAQKQVYFFAQRSMYEDEFDRIWKQQAKHFVQVKQLRQQIHGYLFYQRPLKSQKGRVGSCGLMPKNRRAMLATPEFQEYRIRCVINNIKIEQTANHQEVALCQPEYEYAREALYRATQDPEKLNEKGRISTRDVAKVLSGAMDRTIKAKDLNYSRPSDDSSKDGLTGNRIHLALYKALGKERWDALSGDTEYDKVTKLIELMITTPNKLHLYKCLVNKWGFEKGLGGSAYKLATCELEDGYGKYSRKAINKLLPGLRKGLYQSDAIDRAGLMEASAGAQNKNKRLLDLRDLTENPVANPVVDKALWEIRRVVNSIIKRHGFPEEIRIELARDMKERKSDRIEKEKKQAKNRRINEEAEREIIEHIRQNDIPGLQATRHRTVHKSDRDKYKMWHNEQDKQCVFCGRPIGMSELFDASTEVEHIWPQAGFRQNYTNTVMACRDCNQEKADRTPFQAWGETERWQQIKIRVEKLAKEKKLPVAKKSRILKTDWNPEDESEFVERQLRDTSYIALQAKNTLEKTGCPVGVSRGGAVSELRHLWGVNNVLPRHPEEEAIYKETDQRTASGDLLKIQDQGLIKEIKNRKDHRHHAIDAFMVAMTDHGMLTALTKAYQEHRKNTKSASGKHKKRDALPLPKSWEDNKNLHVLLKKKLLPSVVSHAAQRKITGALHEETAYGKSSYLETLDINTNASTINKIKQYLDTDPDAEGNVTWIAEPAMRTLLRAWIKETEPLPAKERTLPKTDSGTVVERITLANRCYTVRKTVEEALKYVDKDPGKGTWIVDPQCRHSLRQWHQKHGKDLKQALLTNPPRLIDKKGEAGEIIKRVVMARKHGAKSIAALQQHKIFALGNVHHVVIFWNGKEGKESERKGYFVSALEARRRVSRGEAVIQRTPPPEWEGEWHYEMNLCPNDMVLWTGELEEETSLGATENVKTGTVPWNTDIQKRIFRVQKLSSTDLITLRHHSVATTSDRHGLVHCRPNTLSCKKIYPGNLGWTPERPPFYNPPPAS